MGFDARAEARRIERALARKGRAERRAFFAQGHAPSRLRILGVSVPDLRAIVGRTHGALRNVPPRGILDVALALARGGTAEGRQAGCGLIGRRRDAFALLTQALLRRLGRGNDNWASVDAFAMLADRVWLAGLVPDEEIVRWAGSRDRWWRRAALAVTVVLSVPARGGPPRTLAICAHFAAETDPMLAKGLSWALRSLAGPAPAAVGAFLARHAVTLPAIVRREVGRKLKTGTRN